MPGAPGDGTPGIGDAATGGVAGLCAPLTAGAMRNVKLARALTRSAAPRRRGRSCGNRCTRDLSDDDRRIRAATHATSVGDLRRTRAAGCAHGPIVSAVTAPHTQCHA